MVMVESPYRSLVGPLLSYIDALDQQTADDTITVVLPESLPSKPWEYILHNHTALRLKASLLFRPNTIVADVPHVLGRAEAWRSRDSSRGRAMLASVPWGGLFFLLLIILLVYQLIFDV